jgi:hypothetical protein
MASAPAPRDANSARSSDNAIAVISAYGAFRVLMVLLALWTFFAGFSLITQGVGALSFGDNSASAERVVGAQMMMLAPVYGLLAWRRDEYRLLIWIPYAAQLAIILPTVYDLFISRDRDFQEGALMLIVSLIFFVLLVYFWFSSKPADFFHPAEDDGEEGLDADDEEVEQDGLASPPPSRRNTSY